MADQTTHHQSHPHPLQRSRHNRIIGGVAGGMANYFHLDPVLMRVIFVLLMFLPGPGLLAYLLAWLLIPLEPETAPQPA